MLTIFGNALNIVEVSDKIQSKIMDKYPIQGRKQIPRTSRAELSRLANHKSTQPLSNPAIWSNIKTVEQQWLLQQKHHAKLPRRSVGGSLTAISGSLAQVPEISVPALKDPEWIKSLSNVFRSVDSYFGQINLMVERVAVNLAAPLSGITRISEQLVRPIDAWQQVIANIPSIWNFDGFWETLRPILESIESLMEDAEAGREVLRVSEFGFADHFWTIFYVRGFANLDPQTRSATVTNKLAAFTRSEQFVEQFRDGSSESKLMTRRWRIIESAIEAHASRNYDLSVPALLAQIEGVLVDLMFLKDLVKKEGNKFYLVDKNGNFKAKEHGRNSGQRLPAVTLSPAITHAKLTEHSNLAAASEFLADTLVQRRNAILHGHDLTYGKAKLSVQALLILTVLAEAVAELES